MDPEPEPWLHFEPPLPAQENREIRSLDTEDATVLTSSRRAFAFLRSFTSPDRQRKESWFGEGRVQFADVTTSKSQEKVTTKRTECSLWTVDC